MKLSTEKLRKMQNIHSTVMLVSNKNIVKWELNTVTLCDSFNGEIDNRNVYLKNVIPYFTEINIE